LTRNRFEYTRAQAEEIFKRKEEAPLEYQKTTDKLREKTARLRALRLARDQADKMKAS
jgi:hypothetical protein